MYAWSSRARLCPLRMVWLDDNYNDPVYELTKLHRRNMRRYPKQLQARTRVPNVRFRHRVAPGRLGEWPVFKHGTPVERIRL